MKRIPVFLCCAAVVFAWCAAGVFAQTYTTGQAARAVIGQETFTSQDTNSGKSVIGSASGIAYAADTLFVADSNGIGASPSNNRVLVFSNLSSQLPAPTAEIPNNSKCPVCVGQASVVLGQPDFVTTTVNIPATANSLRNPQAVASDGVHLVVADTDHNRVLIWNHIPTSNNSNADVVIGQPNFTSVGLPGNTPNAQSMRGPQGVWLQDGKLYVADTQNNRVLVFNHIPTTNGVAADIVLGAPNFTTYVNPDLTQQQTGATASTMFSPVAVTSDGIRLFVSDLGFNRVLIFNTIPTTNGAAADVALGQPDLVTSVANNAFTGTAATSSTDSTDKETPALCTVSNGIDLYGNLTYPTTCNATLNFPRFAMAVNGQLLVADGGNDRVLVWQKMPTANGTLADTIIGQIGGDINQASDAADSLRTPTSMAWDGTNLYVSDTYNRRITVYTIGNAAVGYQGIRNAASLNITASGSLTVSGSIQAGDVITITIGNLITSSNASNNYTYTVLATDTLQTVVTGIINAINGSNSGAGDPNVVASREVTTLATSSTPTTSIVLLTARQSGDLGNNITYSATAAPAANIVAAEIVVSRANPNLGGGGDAAKVAPGTVVTILANAGTSLSAGTASWDVGMNQLPRQLAGTEVYFNGIQSPLLYVSPTQINAQVPWELGDQTSISAFVRSVMPDGSIMFTSAVAVSIVPANPGIYAQGGTSNPEQGLVFHTNSNATAVVSVDGQVAPGSTASITINGRSYSYTATDIDTLDSVRDALIEQINTDPQVSASAAGVFDRIILKARVAGPEGNGIPVSGTATGGSLTITVIDEKTCCGNIAGTPVTLSNPAVPGEIITVYATGLGFPVLTDAVQPLIQTGLVYPATGPNTVPQEFVSSIAGGSTGDVLQATLLPGTAGGYKVLLHLNPGLVTSTNTLVDIAQDVYISNQVAFPLVNPNNVSSLDPVLSLLVQHTGNFTPGEQAAAYIITVSNVGTGNPTSGPVTLVETIPTGLTLVNMVGDGWSCSGNTCTRSDALGAGTAWPTITVIVNVASNSPSSVVNMVRITGGDSSAATYDDTTIVTGTTPSNPPNLSVTMKPSGAFTKGQTASFTLSVNNAKGASASSGAVTVIEAFPPGLSLVSMTGENWICTGDTCTRSDSLGAGIGYPVITVTVNVAANAPSSVTNMVILIGGGSATSVTNEVIAVN